jgi:hypothetical protein
LGRRWLRGLRVATGWKDGSPVTGTVVELGRPLDSDVVDIETDFRDISELWGRNGYKAILLQKGVTDARGVIVLTGPPGERLAVRVLGPGHQPAVVNDVVLASPGTVIRVAVDRGATLTGTVRPLESITGLRPSADLLARWRDRDASAGTVTHILPGLWLERGGSSPAFFPIDGQISFEEDGSFSLGGIPPGTWRLMLLSPASLDETSYVGKRELLQTVELVEGETRTLDLVLEEKRGR